MPFHCAQINSLRLLALILWREEGELLWREEERGAAETDGRRGDCEVSICLSLFPFYYAHVGINRLRLLPFPLAGREQRHEEGNALSVTPELGTDGPLPLALLLWFGVFLLQLLLAAAVEVWALLQLLDDGGRSMGRGCDRR